jgi:hypothetical protein
MDLVINYEVIWSDVKDLVIGYEVIIGFSSSVWSYEEVLTQYGGWLLITEWRV